VPGSCLVPSHFAPASALDEPTTRFIGASNVLGGRDGDRGPDLQPRRHTAEPYEYLFAALRMTRRWSWQRHGKTGSGTQRPSRASSHGGRCQLVAGLDVVSRQTRWADPRSAVRPDGHRGVPEHRPDHRPVRRGRQALPGASGASPTPQGLPQRRGREGQPRCSATGLARPADDITVEQAQAALDDWCCRRGDIRLRPGRTGGKFTVAALAEGEPLRPVPPAHPAELTVERTASAQALGRPPRQLLLAATGIGPDCGHRGAPTRRRQLAPDSPSQPHRRKHLTVPGLGVGSPEVLKKSWHRRGESVRICLP
jgi:hypothetical protein